VGGASGILRGRDGRGTARRASLVGNVHKKVTLDTPSGGAVFSAGSINYAASLPVNEHASGITANVLRRLLS
jgi:hypothetical protein